ncbi:hypothetical protein [Alkalihalobacterium chitinilyticum]|uniref:DUF3784 domain-containing protein n=1 Tax=Alkalihalobacterium chitinilyticum TaxID=2980103 RepID=A0ABT5VDS6_9BACI|nr:hypothetical protein [Alkalihalobacterium chitinilyticum]MDE5412633.1 hypothetical protein [Alkalihalobacterium chitinilyticum]
MANLVIDFILLALCIIGLTALMGTITNVFGMKIFGRGNVDKFKTKSSSIQSGWKKVGGR